MRTLVFAAATACLLPLPSCIVVAAAAVGAAAYGAISYHENEAEMDVQRELPVVYEAAKAAMQELGFPVDATQQPGLIDGTLKSGDAKVTVERRTGDITRVRAVVGTFHTDDNERRAKLILEAIRRRL